MDYEETTIQECIDKSEKEKQSAIINDGKIIGFSKEK